MSEMKVQKPKLCHRIKQFFSHESSSRKTIEGKLSSQRFVSADAMFAAMATKPEFGSQFKTPFGPFMNGPDARDEFLVKFITAAVKEGSFTNIQIADAIEKFEYPSRLANYVSMDQGQAPSEVVISLTTRLDLSRLFEGETPIIEGGRLLTGTFGPRGIATIPEEIDVENVMAHIDYLIKHSQAEGLPLPSTIFIPQKARSAADFALAKKIVIKCQEHIEDGHIGFEDNHYYSVDDTPRKYSAKFRLVGLVFDMTDGELKVVDKGKPTMKYIDWSQRAGAEDSPDGLCELLSASRSEIARYKAWGKEIRLLHKLIFPDYSNGGKDYHPWQDLKDSLLKLKDEQGLESESHPHHKFIEWQAKLKRKHEKYVYKLANNIWSYHIIKRQGMSIKNFQKNWKRINEIAELRQSRMKLGCDDGRHDCDHAAFGGLLTQDEFVARIRHLKNGGGTRVERFEYAAHEFCGFVKDITNAMLLFERLVGEYKKDADRLRNDPNSKLTDADITREYSKSVRYMARLFEYVLATEGMPVAHKGRFGTRLPKFLQEEWFAKIENRPAIDEGNRKMVDFLFDLFVGNQDMLRSAVRRAYAVGLIEADEKTGMLSMPSLDNVRNGMKAILEENEIAELMKNDYAVKFLVGQEVARIFKGKYSAWMNGLLGDERVDFEAYFDSFVTGQRLEIMAEPSSKADLLHPKLVDRIIKRYTYEEIEEYKRLGQDDPEYAKVASILETRAAYHPYEIGL